MVDQFSNEYLMKQIKELALEKNQRQQVYKKWKRLLIFKYCYPFIKTFKQKFELVLINKKVEKLLKPIFYQDVLYS